MSVVNVTIKCDWPQCENVLMAKLYPGFLSDMNWAQLYAISGCDDVCRYPHLCSTHRHKTKEEFDEVRMAPFHTAAIREWDIDL